LATELSPISLIARLTPYLAGSATITAYSPYPQVLGETLQWARKDFNYLATSLTESWHRTYQVSRVWVVWSGRNERLRAMTRVIEEVKGREMRCLVVERD
jgi:hypothetical protein